MTNTETTAGDPARPPRTPHQASRASQPVSWRLAPLLIAPVLLSTSLMAASPTGDATRVVYLDMVPDGHAELTLGGRVHTGEWREKRCPTAQCRAEFMYIQKAHREHVRNGTASLTDSDGAHLECAWVRHDSRVHGKCRGPDGQTYVIAPG